LSNNDSPASQPNSPAPDPDSLEVVAGASHEKLQGRIPELATAEELRSALEQAFDYRGDVLITRKDGSKIEGYIFDRRTGKTLADSFVRLHAPSGLGNNRACRYLRRDSSDLSFRCWLNRQTHQSAITGKRSRRERAIFRSSRKNLVSGSSLSSPRL